MANQRVVSKMELDGPWMVSSSDDQVKRFPKTLAGAKSIVRAAARRGVALTIYEQTRNVPGQGPHYYPLR